MEQVLGIGGVFFKARESQGPRRLVSRTPRRARRTRADLRGFHVCRGWRADGLVCVSCEHLLLRFGPGTVHGQLSRPEPRRHLGPTPSCRAQVDDRVEDTDYGRFGWATDPEGNRFELWELRPPGQG